MLITEKRFSKRNRRNIWLYLAIGLVSCPVISAEQPTANIVFAGNAVMKKDSIILEQVPEELQFRIDPEDVRDTFACGESIFAVVAVENMLPGQYQLSSVWKSPAGEIVKTAEKQMNIPVKQQVVYMASSISLQKPADNASDKSPFNGSWTVEVVLDDILITSGQFAMDC